MTWDTDDCLQPVVSAGNPLNSRINTVPDYAMAQKTISSRNIKGIIIHHAIHGDGATLIARSFKIAKSTVHAYIKLYDNSDLVHTDILNLSANNIAASIRPQKNIYENARHALLNNRLLRYHQRLKPSCGACSASFKRTIFKCNRICFQRYGQSNHS